MLKLNQKAKNVMVKRELYMKVHMLFKKLKN